MLEIDEKTGTIKLTRGDTATFNVSAKVIVNGVIGEDYIIQPTDKVSLKIKKKIKDSETVLVKESIGSGTIGLIPSDTKSLAFGQYVYDVEIVKASGDIFTIITHSPFIVDEEV